MPLDTRLASAIAEEATKIENRYKKQIVILKCLLCFLVIALTVVLRGL